MYVNKELEKFNNELKGKKVAVIGLGVSNIPLLDYLINYGANVTIFDSKELNEFSQEIQNKIEQYNLGYSFGEKYLSKLKGFDLIFRSPSCLSTVLELEAEAKRGAIVTTEIELLMKMCPCKIIGITGSEGKTTTTTLIYKIIKDAGLKCHLGGNIGIPLFTKLNEIEPEDIIILELSSFQLMNMKISSDISIITNITPNHLNIHKNYDEYIEAKKNIFKHQNKDGIVILNNNNEITKNCSNEANGKVILFDSKKELENGYIVENKKIYYCKDGTKQEILDTKKLKIRGMHNFENICCALAAIKNIVNIESAVNTIKNFSGVEHRLEFIREKDGVKWYNDSASTSPTRTIAGINAFDENIVLIAGGYDKNLDYIPIAKPILDKVRVLLLIGGTTEKIYNAVIEENKKQNKNIKIYKCNSLKETVDIANKEAKHGDIVLLSPASASFDMFKSAYDRGNQFKDLVNKLV